MDERKVDVGDQEDGLLSIHEVESTSFHGARILREFDVILDVAVLTKARNMYDATLQVARGASVDAKRSVVATPAVAD